MSRLHHAIETWATTRSPAHAAALNSVVDDIRTELDMLRARTTSQAEALGAAAVTIERLQAQVSDTAAPAVLQALSDLCCAYRALGGLDHAWDEPLLRAERALTGQPLSAAAEIGGAA